jgi:hypothetical protein
MEEQDNNPGSLYLTGSRLPSPAELSEAEIAAMLKAGLTIEDVKQIATYG